MAEQGHFEDSEPQISGESNTAKVKFWHHFAMRHLPEMKLLFRGGKLWNKEGWRNVVEHSLPQGVYAEVLSEILQLPEKEKEKLVRNVICHDWDKRLEKKPKDFSEEDIEKNKRYSRGNES